MESTKDIPPHERLIFPLDVPSIAEAKQLVETLGDAVTFYKVGLELLLSDVGYAATVDWLTARHKKVMLDIKIFDIARTTAAAVRQVAGRGVTFVTVHANDEILRAAIEARDTAAPQDRVKLLAVTVLTSLDEKDMEDLGWPPGTRVQQVVLHRARRAVELGCDGIVSSGLEAEALRGHLGHNFLVVVPGVRPGANREVADAAATGYADDQKRVVGIEEAFEKGADYVVVGRPIRKAPDPRAAAEDIQRQIAAWCARHRHHQGAAVGAV